MSNTMSVRRAPATASSRGFNHIAPLSMNAYTHFFDAVDRAKLRVATSGYSHVTSNSVASGSTAGMDDNRSASKYCCTAPSEGAR